MTKNKKLEDCPILTAEYKAVRQTILRTIKIDILKICIYKVYIHIDSQIVINVVNEKITVPKDIKNLVKDIRCLLSYRRLAFFLFKKKKNKVIKENPHNTK